MMFVKSIQVQNHGAVVNLLLVCQLCQHLLWCIARSHVVNKGMYMQFPESPWPNDTCNFFVIDWNMEFYKSCPPNSRKTCMYFMSSLVSMANFQLCVFVYRALQASSVLWLSSLKKKLFLQWSSASILNQEECSWKMTSVLWDHWWLNIWNPHFSSSNQFSRS